MEEFTYVCFGTYPNGKREPIKVLLDLIDKNDVEVVLTKNGNSGILKWAGCGHLAPFTLIQ